MSSVHSRLLSFHFSLCSPKYTTNKYKTIMQFTIFDAKELLAKYDELKYCPVDKAKVYLELTEHCLFGSASTHTTGFLYVDKESQECKSCAWEGRDEEKKAAIFLAVAHKLLSEEYPYRYKRNDYGSTEPGREFLAFKALFEGMTPETAEQKAIQKGRDSLINPSYLVNAKQELTDFLEQQQLGVSPTISWATLRKRISDTDDFCFFDLMFEYTEQDYVKFLDSLDFEYESNGGRSCQNLFGIVVLTDGTWIGRNTDTLLKNKLTGEYFKDGKTERWQYHKLIRNEQTVSLLN
jgi:hypothetical protein